jgi:hypothetical protein
MSTHSSSRTHVPRTVAASLDARLAPFHLDDGARLEDLDVEAARAVAPQREGQLKLRLVNDLKLLFAALGAGGSVVPLGDNGRTAHLLANYAASLRDH